MFSNTPDDTKTLCHMSQHCKSSQTEGACIATSKCVKSKHSVTLTQHENHVAEQIIFVTQQTC